MFSVFSRRTLAAACLFLAAAPSFAQVAIPDEYEKHIQKHGLIGALTGEVAGDRISPGNGALEIVQTDIDLPGNNALPVRVGRRFKPNENYLKGHFDGWDLDIPNAHGVFGNTGSGSGWINTWSGTTNRVKRCSLFSYPPAISYQGGSWDTDEFWQGSYLYLPGGGDQEMLARSATSAHVPTDGNSYPIVTRVGSAVRCVALASTSESGSLGEGFEVVTPDGTVYTLNQMVSRLEGPMNKAEPAPMLVAGGATTSSKTVTSQLAANYVLPRKEFLLYPTKATDRFGNTVTYTWSSTNPWQLTQILASDGRHLDFTYQSSSSVLVTSITDGPHTWQYGYVGSPNDLSTVTLPDGSSWAFQLTSLRTGTTHPQSTTCDATTAGTGTKVGTVTSPSGAMVEFTLAQVVSGRSWVFRECLTDLSNNGHAREPYLFVSLAVTGKKITGPGLPTGGLNWTYSYGAANPCWDPASSITGACTGSSPTTRTVTVTEPASAVTRYTFGNRFGVNEGLLLSTDHGWNGSTGLRTESITYADPTAAPYAAYNGATMRHMGDYDVATLYRPQRKVVTLQQGRTFTWEVASDCSGLYCFDTFARPTKVIKTSVSP